MKEGEKYLKKGQVLVFFLVFIALCGLIVITVGIDIFRVSQTKIMIQTAVDGRALHLISLYAKQLNFLADINNQMLQPAEHTYPARCNYDAIRNLGGKKRSGGKWISASEFRPYNEPDDGKYTYNWESHTEGHGDCSTVDASESASHSCRYPSFAYQSSPGTGYTCTRQYTSISTPSIWDEPPKVNEFDVESSVSNPERAFSCIQRMEEYRDDFIKPRTDLQDTVIEKIGKQGSGLISVLAYKELELGAKDDSKITPIPTADADFANYREPYWTTHRKEISLPYIVWDYHTSSWTHSYQSGTQSGFTCTVRREWWTVHKDGEGKDLTKAIGGWLYFDDGIVNGDAIPGSLNVTAKRDITGLKFGSEDHIAEDDFVTEASVELDSSTGELWPEPDPSYKIKFK